MDTLFSYGYSIQLWIEYLQIQYSIMDRVFFNVWILYLIMDRAFKLMDTDTIMDNVLT